MRAFIIISVLGVLTPTVLLANDEVTLEGLAELFASLSGRTDDFEDRVGRWNGCLIGVDTFTARDLDLQAVRDETVLKYKEQYGDWLDLNEVRISSILYNTDTKAIGIMSRTGWADSGLFVIEEWSEREFVKASDWWKE